MARLFNRYDEKNPPMQCFMRQTRWYKESGSFTPRGILLHDTGANNDMLRRYVQPDDNAADREELIALLGKNQYGNDWNHGGKNDAKGVNAFIGRLDDGKVTTMQTGPWTKRPWGCGSQKKNDVYYSLNDTHIQWEMCEDALTNVEYFGDCYEETIALCAYLCKKFDINPQGTIKYNGLTIPTIVCHWDSYVLGCGSGHDDIYDWTAMYDYLGIPKSKVNINDPYNNPINLRIREDIKKAMETKHEPGWEQDGGKWYYYDENGLMVCSDWIRYKGQWYYLGDDGVMLTGWQTIDQTEYFFHSDGHMAQGEWIDGLYLEMGGAQTYKYKGSWKKNSKGSWWEDTSGWYPTNRSVMINSKSYSFGKSGYVKG